MTRRTGLYSKRFQPTAAQLRVLTAMADGTVLVRGYVNARRWYLQGSGASVNTSTAEAIRCAAWIATDDAAHPRYFTLTPMGLAALRQMREGVAA